MSGFELFWLILMTLAFIVAMGLMATMLVRAGRPGDYRWMVAFVVAIVLVGVLGSVGSMMFS